MPLPLAAVVWTGVRWAVKKGIKKAAKRVVKRTKKTPKPSSKATQKSLKRLEGDIRGKSKTIRAKAGQRQDSMFKRTKAHEKNFAQRPGYEGTMEGTRGTLIRKKRTGPFGMSNKKPTSDYRRRMKLHKESKGTILVATIAVAVFGF